MEERRSTGTSGAVRQFGSMTRQPQWLTHREVYSWDQAGGTFLSYWGTWYAHGQDGGHTSVTARDDPKSDAPSKTDAVENSLQDLIDNILKDVSTQVIDNIASFPHPPTFRAGIFFTETDKIRYTRLVFLLRRHLSILQTQYFLLNQITSRFAIGSILYILYRI